MLKRTLAGVTALSITAIMTLGAVSAAPNAQDGPTRASFDFLIAVLRDANDRGALSDEINDLLSDLLIEYLVAPHTGETKNQVDERLSVEGQSTFEFLFGVLTDANDMGEFSDEISTLLSDLFIEYLIAPRTGETGQR